MNQPDRGGNDPILILRESRLEAVASRKRYPAAFGRIHFNGVEKDHHLHFLTDSFHLPALTNYLLHKSRGQVNLFFKTWMRQQLFVQPDLGRD